MKLKTNRVILTTNGNVIVWEEMYIIDDNGQEFLLGTDIGPYQEPPEDPPRDSDIPSIELPGKPQ